MRTSDQRPLHFVIGRAFLEQERTKDQGDTRPANNLMHNSYALIIAGVLLSKKCNRGASGEILAAELGT